MSCGTRAAEAEQAGLVNRVAFRPSVHLRFSSTGAKLERSRESRKSGSHASLFVLPDPLWSKKPTSHEVYRPNWRDRNSLQETSNENVDALYVQYRMSHETFLLISNASEQPGRHLPPLEHNADPQAHSKRDDEQRRDYRHRGDAGHIDEAQKNPVNLLVKQVHPKAVPLEQAPAHLTNKPLGVPEDRQKRKRTHKPQDEQQNLRGRPEGTPPPKHCRRTTPRTAQRQQRATPRG